jgi:hypothetical protein
MIAMMMLDVLQEQDAVSEEKDEVKCVGSAKRFQVIECQLDCACLIL